MNSPTQPFSYVVLRYMHDPFTREFVNIAILLCAPTLQFLSVKSSANLSRVQAMFPGADLDSLAETLAFFESRAREISATLPKNALTNTPSADTIAQSILPQDDSALQWSPPGGGITDSPQETLDQIFALMVAKHCKPEPQRSTECS